jgi:hypothetical protein
MLRKESFAPIASDRVRGKNHLSGFPRLSGKRCSRPLAAVDDGARIPCYRARWHKQVFAAMRLCDSMSWGA